MARFLPRSVTTSWWPSSSPERKIQVREEEQHDDSRSESSASFPNSSGASIITGKHAQRSANALLRLDALRIRNAKKGLAQARPRAQKSLAQAHLPPPDDIAFIRQCLATAQRCVQEFTHPDATARRIRMRGAGANPPSDGQPRTDALPTDSVRGARPATASLGGHDLRRHHHSATLLRSFSNPVMRAPNGA